MNSNAELFALLDRLVDGWCERRALRPLSMILQAYPMASALSDSWHELRQTLRNLRCLREPELTQYEVTMIEDSLRAVEAALSVTGWNG